MPEKRKLSAVHLTARFNPAHTAKIRLTITDYGVGGCILIIYRWLHIDEVAKVALI
jgi:hypothetical protein